MTPRIPSVNVRGILENKQQVIDVSNDKTPSPTSFEASLSELEAIVKEMESGELPLNEALEKFERGIALSRQSQQVLAQAEQKVRILLQEQGQETLRDLSEDSELK